MVIDNRLKINRYCQNIGSNALIVQGAGGNISWKDGNILWVKASGMWLVDAMDKNIFVSVDLKDVLEQVKDKNYSIEIKSIDASNLRPSIETILHAILPHRLVLHIHAIEILAFLVCKDYKKIISACIAEEYDCSYIDYKKPGPDLAKAVSEVINQSPNVQIIFLQNHGIVIGGEDINEIDSIVNNLISNINNLQRNQIENKKIDYLLLPLLKGYEPLKDKDVHNLSINDEYYKHTLIHWSLYPDHVVFLGRKSFCYDSFEDFLSSKLRPDLIFIKNIGIYVSVRFNNAQKAQLRCFYDVIVRIQSDRRLNILDDIVIDGLLNWDSEKYRIKHAK